MLRKMSIEVVKYSDSDYLLIFKDNGTTVRKTFKTADDLLRYNLIRFQCSSIYKDVLFKFSIIEDKTLQF